MSYRLQLIAIISMAQHANPNVTGQMAERRAHCTTFSRLVVTTGISKSVSMPIPISLHRRGTRGRRVLIVRIVLRTPIEDTFAPDVHVPHHENQEENENLHEAGPGQLAHRHGPWSEERDFDIEQQENH